MSFTKNKDVDREIMYRLNDKDLFNVMLTEKYARGLIDEIFWMNRVLHRYPGTFKYKEAHTTWKKFYLSIILCEENQNKIWIRFYERRS